MADKEIKYLSWEELKALPNGTKLFAHIELPTESFVENQTIYGKEPERDDWLFTFAVHPIDNRDGIKYFEDGELMDEELHREQIISEDFRVKGSEDTFALVYAEGFIKYSLA